MNFCNRVREYKDNIEQGKKTQNCRRIHEKTQKSFVVANENSL